MNKYKQYTYKSLRSCLQLANEFFFNVSIEASPIVLKTIITVEMYAIIKFLQSYSPCRGEGRSDGISLSS